MAPVADAPAATPTANFAAYQRAEVQWGATALPLAAQVEYRTAVQLAQNGDLVAAEEHLREATRLDPGFADAYYTLSRIKFRQLNADALYFFVRGVKATWADFSLQSLLVVNALLIVLLALILVSSIMATVLAIRYVPFVAHRLRENLTRRFNASSVGTVAYILLLVPFVAFPGYVTGFCSVMLIAWCYMHRREKIATFLVVAAWAAIGFFSPTLERLAPLTEPRSFTSLVAQGRTAAASGKLVRDITAADVSTLSAEKHNALGLLELRRENYSRAADHFLRAIGERPRESYAYVNLGNVYYLQGLHGKALEGYRKAASIDSLDAVGQYNLAQAYIKTLLMAESSNALRRASAAGIERVKDSYAQQARPLVQVYAKTYTNRDLWRIAITEGADGSAAHLAPVVALTRFPLRMTSWFICIAFVLAVTIARLIKKNRLSFQCSNCGELACQRCCTEERGSYLCGGCGQVINGVTSDRVIDALLRQRRQAVVVRRRRAIKLATIALPGMRDLFFGRMVRGLMLATIFAVASVEFWARGLIIPDWNSLDYPTPAWKWILPAAGIAFAYLASLTSRYTREMRNYRGGSNRQRMAENDDTAPARTASA